MVTRLGLIGYGKWGRNIERTLRTFDGVSLVVIGRHEPLRRDLDGVLIATPSATHVDFALPYVEAGIATFVEKPMVTSVADARRIAEAAERAHTPVFVGHVQRYNPAFRALLEMLPGLGDIRYILCESANGNPRTDCSVLWDWLPHDLSMAQAIFGTGPTSVETWALSGTSRCETAVLRFRHGDTSWVSTVSWQSAVRRQCLTIAAERATVIFDDRADRKLALHDTQGIASYPGYDDMLPLTKELGAFLDIVRSGAIDRSHIELDASIAQAIIAAETSISEGGATVSIAAPR
jgi:UDP-N-acetylglucosamine 3-dehydrogenase